MWTRKTSRRIALGIAFYIFAVLVTWEIGRMLWQLQQ